ncbi:MAG: hypothetical protein P9M14_09625, partial [Candidatus Alcyoniella australis]|nr:hypothetical protein [Candidatus Alcyoniella australis]
MSLLMRLLISVALLLLPAAAVAVDDQYLEDKAVEYDQWFQQWCSTGYGGASEVHFTDETLSAIQSLGGTGDSTIWTGTYLAGEAYRYAVTGDQQAFDNAVKAVQTLHTHLKITGSPGYIARYAGPDEAPYNSGYVGGHSRYHQGEGEYEGSFWVGETSRDQYTGWFLGMAVAYDLLDDEEIRQMIREDIVEVVDTARFYYWFIIKETGTPSTVAAQITPTMQLDWSLIEAHVTDDPYYWKLYEERFEKVAPMLPIDAKIGFFNRYYEHYGLNLSHETWFNILRLERDPNRLAFYRQVFDENVRPTVHKAHNVWYDYIYLANFGQAARDYQWTIEDDLR